MTALNKPSNNLAATSTFIIQTGFLNQKAGCAEIELLD